MYFFIPVVTQFLIFARTYNESQTPYESGTLSVRHLSGLVSNLRFQPKSRGIEHWESDVKLKWRSCYFLSGTCINNTSVMMFKKGSFEIGGDVYPVAIKASPNSLFVSSKYKSKGVSACR